jgi:hypothetical protein
MPGSLAGEPSSAVQPTNPNRIKQATNKRRFITKYSSLKRKSRVFYSEQYMPNEDFLLDD